MKAQECSRSRAIAGQINRCEEGLRTVQAAIDDTDRLINPDVISGLDGIKLAYQDALISVCKAKKQHDSSCLECNPPKSVGTSKA
jgi:hypothetical protein